MHEFVEPYFLSFPPSQLVSTMLSFPITFQGCPANRDAYLQTDFRNFKEEEREASRTSTVESDSPSSSSTPATHRFGYGKDIIRVDPDSQSHGPSLGEESMVEVTIRGKPHAGVIRWLGSMPGWPEEEMAGIELEEYIFRGTNGMFDGESYFHCTSGKGVFVYISQCRPDSRFPTRDDTYRDYRRETSKDFGYMESPIIAEYVEPQKFSQESVGENKGIQGDRNSCYLDVSLYSMFAFNLTFDNMLTRVRSDGDCEAFEPIQRILMEKIVSPLRSHGFVRADRVRELRQRLSELDLLPGLTSEEKDPEEFLHMLVKDVFKMPPLITTRHGDTEETDSQYLYQIFMEKNDSLELPTVEQLLHQSFLDNDLKLVEAPECLMVQMPRFGKDYKMYRRILPSLNVDITDLLEKYPRQCTICGELAVLECRDCRPDQTISDTLIKSFCHNCFELTHESSPDHRKKDLILKPEDVQAYEDKREQPDLAHTFFHRQQMELFAVVCIQTSHYVTFVKTDSHPSHWVFFDSMADRDATSVPGFNIPKVTHLKDFELWLRDTDRINKTPVDKDLPEHMRRLLGDAYVCFYRRFDGRRTVSEAPEEWARGATNFAYQ